MVLTRKIYNKNMKIYILLLAIFSLQWQGSSALAQDNQFSAGSTIQFDSEKEEIKPEMDKANIFSPTIPLEAEVTVVEDKHVGDYVQSTVQNLSKLYWKTNALDINNDKVIDNFLMINECEIYQKFYDDDFEWLRVRKAGRAMIKENKDSFPDKFKMIIPIDLGRYDLEKKGFPLISDTAFVDLRRIEIGGNSIREEICSKSAEIEYYPRNLILLLSRPFSYDFVSIDEHIAQAYIIQQKYNPTKAPRRLKDNDFERLAFARIRISFNAYQGETKGEDTFKRAIMFGKLDGIDIFEDPYEKRLLTSVDLTQQ